MRLVVLNLYVLASLIMLIFGDKITVIQDIFFLWLILVILLAFKAIAETKLENTLWDKECRRNKKEVSYGP